MRKFNRVIFWIVVLAAFLRFFQLGNNPPSLTWDEVAWGYNAYSLGIDAKDEFGRFLPVDYLESFGDFKPPLYAYLSILPVKIFGLTEFAVRFPSALFGVLTVFITYFLTKRIFPKFKQFSIFSANWRIGIGEIAALLLAISPWHINLSRVAFEANVASFFLVCGVWLFVSWTQERKWYYLAFSSIIFSLSFYTFNTARVVAPLLGITLAIGFWKMLLFQKRDVLIAVCVAILVLLPTVGFIFSQKASLRFQEVNIFSDINLIQRTNQEIANNNSAWWSRVLHNRRLAYAQEYVHHYFDNFNPRFLFIDGDGNPKFSTRDVGQLYLWELPFFIGGLLVLLKNREKNWWIIPIWLLLGIVPAATARETPHSLRIETTLPTFQIITAYGLVYLISKISNIKYQIAKIQVKYLITTLFFSSVLFNFLYYYHGYYAHYPREFSGEWQYGYKEAITFIKSVENHYKKMYITETLGRPYIYVLFYTRYDPKVFRKEVIVNKDPFGFVQVKSFGKYTFDRNISRYQKRSERLLYLDIPGRIPPKAKILKTFYLLNGKPALIVYTL